MLLYSAAVLHNKKNTNAMTDPIFESVRRERVNTKKEIGA